MVEPRPAAIFVGDAAGLDFLNSVATPVDTPVDWIDDGAGLVSWLDQARLVPGDVLQGLRAKALLGELDKVADQARQLREWFRGFVYRHKGRRLALADLSELEPLNRLLARDERFSQIVLRYDIRPARLELQDMRPWRSPEALLLPIAVTLADLLVTEDFSNVKACEGPACTLLFADHTRGHARRWCSMAICGNRAKQAAHRQRLKARQRQAQQPKACEGPACTLLFADHTRGHARRWCSMAICGNRAKQAAHRQRLKARQHHGSRSDEVE